MNLVLGSNGLLGQTLSAALGEKENIFLTRTDLLDWDSPSVSDRQALFFRKYGKRISNIFVAVGETNSNAGSARLLHSNFLLPKNLLSLGREYGFRVVTFGTVHEESTIDSPYVLSKKKYRNYLNQCQPESFLHFQLHTLYSSDRMHKHSFLGQIVEALKMNTVFKMSNGQQLREFHKANQDVKSIIDITLGAKGSASLYPLSHGNVFQLASIAESIFSYFSKSNLLQMQALTNPINEIYDSSFFAKFPINQILEKSMMEELHDTIKLNLH